MILIASPIGDTHLMGLLIPQMALQDAGHIVMSLPECSPNVLVEAIRKHNPSILVLTCLLSTGRVGIGGLLEALRAAQVWVPVVVGGVTSHSEWVQSLRGVYPAPVVAAKSTQECIDILSTWMDEPLPLSPQTKSAITNFSVQIQHNHDLNELWDQWLPQRALYTLHLGYKGPFEKHLAAGMPEAVTLFNQVQTIKKLILAKKLLTPKSIHQWVPCRAHGDAIWVYNKKGYLVETLPFPRQTTLPKRCLSDYVSSTDEDVMGILFCTAGSVHAQLKEFVAAKRYLDAKILHALCVQTAEALTEKVHYQMRLDAGLPDTRPTQDMISSASYTGKRFSYGYSACPDLTEQHRLFKILDPAPIGIKLTPLSMMAPEASVSALVFTHPEANYFSV